MNTCLHSRLAGAALALWFPALGSLPAKQFGLFTYRVDGEEITITGYPDYAAGHVEIPREIGGMPVISIGGFAYADCAYLTAVAIPSSVTDIAGDAFTGCSKLESIHVEDGNLPYASEEGVLFSAPKDSLLMFPEGKAGRILVRTCAAASPSRCSMAIR